MFKFASLAVLALAALGARADLVVSTETLTQCQLATFQITGSSTGPYWAYIVNSNDACGDAFAEVDNINNNSFNWTVSVPAGTSVMVALEAEDGSEGWSGAMVIGNGDASCLTASSSSSSSSTSTTSTTHSTARGTTLTAPANAVSNTASTADDNSSSTSGASSRAAVGVSSMVALLGAVMAFSL